MAIGCPRIERVKFAVNDAVERHRARSCTNHGSEDQSERSPTGPAAMVSCGHAHRRQREWQREDGMRKAYERSPFLNHGKHSHFLFTADNNPGVFAPPQFV